MIDYLTSVYIGNHSEVRFTTEEEIYIGLLIRCGFNKETGDIYKPIAEILEQRPAKGTWKVRPTYYHVTV